MNKAEFTRRAAQVATLARMGYSESESEALRRISLTLRAWYIRECGDGYGAIERDETSGRPYWVTYCERTGARRRTRIADREAGAERRLRVILRGRPFYLQTDPRGATLYLLREGDVPAGERAESYYTRGVCVY